MTLLVMNSVGPTSNTTNGSRNAPQPTILLRRCRPLLMPIHELMQKIPPESRITNACTVKLSGSPVSADRPRVKVAAVTTSEMVNAPTVAIRNIRSTRRPQKPCGLTPVIAETIPERLRPLFFRTWK